MSDITLFISPGFIKENSLIDGNVDDKYLRISIAKSQRKHILPILGTALYNEISGEIPNPSANNQTLLDDYIQDALLHWVVYEGMDIFHYKVTNKGIMNKNSDNSQPIDQVDVIRLMDRTRDDAEFFSQRLTNFLCANTDIYPLFINPGSAYDTVHPNANNYTTGWCLDEDDDSYGLPISRNK